jgi:hypothetical protein
MADVWSNDPDRTTRRGDTRKTEDVTVIVTETIRHGNYTHVGHGNGATIRDALWDVLSRSPYYADVSPILARSNEMVTELVTTGKTEFGWATYTFGV